MVLVPPSCLDVLVPYVVDYYAVGVCITKVFKTYSSSMTPRFVNIDWDTKHFARPTATTFDSVLFLFFCKSWRSPHYIL